MEQYKNAAAARQHLIALGGEPGTFQKTDDGRKSFEVFTFPDNDNVLILCRFYDDEVEDCEFGLFKSVIPHKFLQKRIDGTIAYLFSPAP